MKKFYLLILLIPLFIPQTIFAAVETSCKDIKTCSGVLVSMINALVPFFIGVGILFFIYGLLKYVYSAGDEKVIAEARTFIIYSIIFLAALISVWGLVALVANTFFPGSTIPQFKSS